MLSNLKALFMGTVEHGRLQHILINYFYFVEVFEKILSLNFKNLDCRNLRIQKISRFQNILDHKDNKRTAKLS